MTNNDVFRKLRYIFSIKDAKMIELFSHSGVVVSKDKIKVWAKKEDDPELVDMSDKELAVFLNGFIIEKRGKREGPQPEAESSLSNNMILRKLKIALNLQSDDMLEIFAAGNRKLSPHELSAFFRKPSNKSFRNCLDQYLRNFLAGLNQRFR